MSFFDILEEYNFLLGGSLLLFGITLLIIKITSLNNDKLYEKLKNSEFNDFSFWILTASLILAGLKLVFLNNF